MRSKSNLKLLTATAAALLMLGLTLASCGADPSPDTAVSLSGGQTTVAPAAPAAPATPAAPGGSGGSDGTDGSNGAAAPAPAETTVAPAVQSVLPDVEVIRIATEERVLLSSLTPADKPLLLWFWAPH